MSPGQTLLGQMSLWQLESVLDVPRSLRFKFLQNRVSNNWDIANIEFPWWWVVAGWFAHLHSHFRVQRWIFLFFSLTFLTFSMNQLEMSKNVNNDSSHEMANFGHCGPFGGNFTQKYKILSKLSLHRIWTINGLVWFDQSWKLGYYM